MKVESVTYKYVSLIGEGKVNIYEVILSGNRDIYIQATDELDAWKQGEKFASKLSKSINT